MEMGGRQEPCHTRPPGPWVSSGPWQEAAGSSEGVAEEFNEEIICRGLAGLKDQRVGVFSRESFRPSGQELWPSVEGTELLPTHQRAFYRRLMWLHLRFYLY